MKKHSLVLKGEGLSMTKAQTISNLCNQKAIEITAILESFNVVSESITIRGEMLDYTTKNPIPDNVITLLKNKAELHGLQAFLMENISIKALMLEEVKKDVVILPEELVYPPRPKLEIAVLIPAVTEEWGWCQLEASELNEYYRQEALASHIGQFIHRGGKLDILRKETREYKPFKMVSFEELKDIPVICKLHHSAEELMALHESLTELHRNAEQKVNYFKAKVKNLVTMENASIAKKNADEERRVGSLNQKTLNTFNTEFEKINSLINEFKEQFEVKRQEKIKEISALKIKVPTIFQSIIDSFKLKEESK